MNKDEQLRDYDLGELLEDYFKQKYGVNRIERIITPAQIQALKELEMQGIKEKISQLKEKLTDIENEYP